MKCLSTFIIIAGFWICTLNVLSQNSFQQGNFYIQNYDHKNYNTSENQIWAITQDNKGIMYFGNNAGVLEYDGTSWTLIEIPNKSTVRSLVLNENNNTIYVGAKGELGYLKPDSTGKLYFVSLVDKIPEEYRNFLDVWQISCINNRIIYRTNYAIYIFEENKFEIILANNRFHQSFSVNNEFYVREWGKGLLKLKNNELIFIEQSEIFADERIYSMLPYNNKILIATRTKGIFLYDSGSNNFTKPIKFKAVDNFLTDNKVYCGIALSKNKFALGTYPGGILMFNSEGQILKQINKQSGLNDNDVLTMYLDQQNNLWAGLNDGISYIIQNSAFTFFSELNGLNGTVYTIKEFENKLYAGTSLGLFVKDKNKKFSFIKNTDGQSWFLDEFNNVLLLGHLDGIFTVKNGKAKNIYPFAETAWNLNQLDDKHILAGLSTGFLVLEYVNGMWKPKHKVKGFSELARHVKIDDKEYIWITQPNKGVYKLKLNHQLDSIIELSFFDSNNGLPSNTNNYVFKINGENNYSRILFGTENGIYKFNRNSNQFIIDDRFNMLESNSDYIDKLTSDTNGNIYFQQGNLKGVLTLQSDGTYKLEKSVLSKLSNIYSENIFINEPNIISFCTREGIILFNPNKKVNYDIPYKTVIRKVICKDSIVYINNVKEDTTDIKRIPFSSNQLNFNYSAVFYENNNDTKYSYYLEGFDNQWSEWSLKNEKEYTNLQEGKYTFKVKSRNIFEQESAIAHFEFEILSPWYRSIIAYIAYLLFGFLFIRLIVKLYTWRIKRENTRLETIVQKRTKDLQEINTQLEEKQADLEVKQEEIVSQAEHLEKVNKELEKHKHHLQLLVNERTSELLAAKVKAEESDRLKSAFLANMSHEIRTPMNAIVGFTGLLEDPEIGNPEKKDIIYHINFNCNTLLHLIDDIIDISKIEAGQLNINKESCDLNRILNELNDTFNEHKHSIQKSNIDIALKLEDNSNLTIYTDPIRLQQVLTNLIDNALKYTERGSIEFGYKLKNYPEGNLIEFFVKDTGIGLSEDQQAIIFSRFTKIEANKKKIYRGAGLGLAISKNIIDLLGGKIWVNSEINKGSTFCFTIPYITEETNTDFLKVKRIKYDGYEWPDKTILIAEDEESNYLYFKMLLSNSKAKVMHANTGKKVIELFRNNTIDLILMDIKMPDIDGIEATKIIKKENKDIPIIAITAFAMEDDEQLCKAAGCNEYMQKPIQKNDLFKVINKFLS